MQPDHVEFNEYRALLRQLDLKIAHLQKQHSQRISCAKGCHSCCQSKLSVAHVEAEHIKAWLSNHPELIKQLNDLAAENPWNGTRCQLLDAHGACSIYPVRPVICRSHGLPIRFTEPSKQNQLMAEPSKQTDVCPLNFSEVALDQLSDEDVIDIDKLNTILAVINIRFDQSQSKQRIPLLVSSLSVPKTSV